MTSTAIPMLLWCPECMARHVDVGEFATKEHHTHACQDCGMVWRPAIVATVGVRFLPGFKNEKDFSSELSAQGADVDAAYNEGWSDAFKQAIKISRAASARDASNGDAELIRIELERAAAMGAPDGKPSTHAGLPLLCSVCQRDREWHTKNLVVFGCKDVATKGNTERVLEFALQRAKDLASEGPRDSYPGHLCSAVEKLSELVELIPVVRRIVATQTLTAKDCRQLTSILAVVDEACK